MTSRAWLQHLAPCSRTAKPVHAALPQTPFQVDIW